MRTVRVLVVDDSVVIRRLVTEVLAEDPEIEIVGTASDGRIAITKVASLKPDVVTLDIEMPHMTGLECLTELRKTNPRLPIIMFSTLTERGAAATLDALALGASDYVTKPANVGSVQAGMQAIREQLIPRVKALGGVGAGPVGTVVAGGIGGVAAPPSAPSTSPTAAGASAPSSGVDRRARTTPTTRPPSSTRPPVVPRSPAGIGGVRPAPNPARPAAVPAAAGALSGVPATARPMRRPGGVEALLIGTSTGGPTALATLWPKLPASFPVPILIVQHMPPTFTTLLAERLSRAGAIPVAEAVDGEEIVAGRAYLAPGDFHMVVERSPSGGRIRVNQAPPEHSCRPAVDPLFRSAAQVYGRGALAVVLTGMGADGCDGSRAVRDAGGQVLAQDEATSVVWGMPGAVVTAGLADQVVPLDGVAAAIAARIDSPRATTGLRAAAGSVRT